MAQTPRMYERNGGTAKPAPASEEKTSETPQMQQTPTPPQYGQPITQPEPSQVAKKPAAPKDTKPQEPNYGGLQPKEALPQKTISQSPYPTSQEIKESQTTKPVPAPTAPQQPKQVYGPVAPQQSPFAPYEQITPGITKQAEAAAAEQFRYQLTPHIVPVERAKLPEAQKLEKMIEQTNVKIAESQKAHKQEVQRIEEYGKKYGQPDLVKKYESAAISGKGSAEEKAFQEAYRKAELEEQKVASGFRDWYSGKENLPQTIIRLSSPFGGDFLGTKSFVKQVIKGKPEEAQKMREEVLWQEFQAKQSGEKFISGKIAKVPIKISDTKTIGVSIPMLTGYLPRTYPGQVLASIPLLYATGAALGGAKGALVAAGERTVLGPIAAGKAKFALETGTSILFGSQLGKGAVEARETGRLPEFITLSAAQLYATGPYFAKGEAAGFKAGKIATERGILTSQYIREVAPEYKQLFAQESIRTRTGIPKVEQLQIPKNVKGEFATVGGDIRAFELKEPTPAKQTIIKFEEGIGAVYEKPTPQKDIISFFAKDSRQPTPKIQQITERPTIDITGKPMLPSARVETTFKLIESKPSIMVKGIVEPSSVLRYDITPGKPIEAAPFKTKLFYPESTLAQNIKASIQGDIRGIGRIITGESLYGRPSPITKPAFAPGELIYSKELGRYTSAEFPFREIKPTTPTVKARPTGPSKPFTYGTEGTGPQQTITIREIKPTVAERAETIIAKAEAPRTAPILSPSERLRMTMLQESDVYFAKPTAQYTAPAMKDYTKQFAPISAFTGALIGIQKPISEKDYMRVVFPATSTKLENIIKPAKEYKPTQDTIQLPFFEQEKRIRQKEGIIELPTYKSAQATQQQQASIPMQQTAQASQSALAQELRQAQATETRTARTPMPSYPTLKIPTTYTPIERAKSGASQSPLSRPNYVFYSRRSEPKGKSEVRGTRITEGPLNRGLNQTAKVVDNTSDRTIVAVRKGYTTQPDDFTFYLQNKFRAPRSKKLKSTSAKVYVEKERNSIDTRGEIEGISARGWIARRKRESKKNPLGLNLGGLF